MRRALSRLVRTQMRRHAEGAEKQRMDGRIPVVVTSIETHSDGKPFFRAVTNP